MRFSCMNDSLTERIGLRHISTSGTQLLLNGRPLFLRGICVHEDDLLLGKVSTEADVRRRLTDARAMGCNSCDCPITLTMSMWHAWPTRWACCCGQRSRSTGRSTSATPEPWKMRATNCQSWCCATCNRASVIIWGVGNENADSDARLAFMRDLGRNRQGAGPEPLGQRRLPDQPRALPH